MRTSRRARLTSDAGETLVELLVSIAILSIVGVALMTGLGTAISASGTHRSIASVNTVLKSYAENATYQIELASPPLYSDSASAATYTSELSSTWTPPSGYSGYSLSVSSVSPVPACGTAAGAQQLTIAATGPTSVGDTLTIVVRNPDYSTSYVGC